MMDTAVLVYIAGAIGIISGWTQVGCFANATPPLLPLADDEKHLSASFPFSDPLATINDGGEIRQHERVRRGVPRSQAAGASGHGDGDAKNYIRRMAYSIWSPNSGYSVNNPRRFGMARHRMAMVHKTKQRGRYGGQRGKQMVNKRRMVIKRNSCPGRGYGRGREGKTRKLRGKGNISAFHHPPGSSVRVIGKRWARVQSSLMAIPAWTFTAKPLVNVSSNMETNDKNQDKRYGRFDQFIQLRLTKGAVLLLMTPEDYHRSRNRRSIGLNDKTSSFRLPSLVQETNEDIRKQNMMTPSEIAKDESIPKRPLLWYLMERKKQGTKTKHKTNRPRFLSRVDYEGLFPHSSHPSGSMRPNMGGHGGHYPEFTSHMTWGKRTGVTNIPILASAPRTMRKRFHVTQNFFRILNEEENGKIRHPGGGSSSRRMVNALSASNPDVSWVALPSASASSSAQQNPTEIGAAGDQKKKNDVDFHGDQTDQSVDSGMSAGETKQEGNIDIRNWSFSIPRFVHAIL